MKPNSLSIPAVLLASVSLTLTSYNYDAFNKDMNTFFYNNPAFYQTVSSENIIPDTISGVNITEAKMLSPKAEAMALFGGQSDYSKDEMKAYREMLNRNSKPLGINIFDLI